LPIAEAVPVHELPVAIITVPEDETRVHLDFLAEFLVDHGEVLKEV
jgi:hypothetical protein